MGRLFVLTLYLGGVAGRIRAGNLGHNASARCDISHGRRDDRAVCSNARIRAFMARKRYNSEIARSRPAVPPTLQIIQVTLQALSAFAIAGGLLYTAFQFRNARKAQEVANFAKLVELQFTLRKMRVDRPELAKVHKLDSEQLHTDREVQEYFLNLMQLSLFEIAWYAHEHQQLPADYFDSWKKRMKQLGNEESFRQMLNNPAMKIMHDDFDTFLRKLLSG